MKELLITSSLDPIEEGQVFTGELPRHVTVWQYFKLRDEYVEDFTAEVEEVTQGFEPLEIIGAEKDNFGPNNNVPVRRVMALGAGATLITLHSVLGAVIDKYDGEVRNQEWSFEGYSPHVTYVGGRALDKGEYAKLKAVEIIEKKTDPNRKIVQKILELTEV